MRKPALAWFRERRQRGTTTLELLGVISILSLSFIPLFYLARLTRTTNQRSEHEFTATLLAHHVVERIVARFQQNPRNLPTMTREEPLVPAQDGSGQVSEYFQFPLGDFRVITPEDSPRLYWSLLPFSCRVDTYYLEETLYKVIVYIFYEEDGQKKQVYLERLLDHPSTPGDTP